MSKIEEFFEKAVAAGYIPQVPVNYDTVAYKIYTTYLENKIDELTAENAELRARLDKAVELPVKVGDTIYIELLDKIKEWQVEKIELCKDEYLVYCEHADTNDHTFVTSKEYGMRWFTDPVKAVLRLKELQDVKGDRNRRSE